MVYIMKNFTFATTSQCILVVDLLLLIALHIQGPHGSLKSLKVFKNMKSMKSL